MPLQQTFETYVRAVEDVQDRLEMMEKQLQDLAQSEPYSTPIKHLRCLKGVDTLSALTLLVEVQDFRRFHRAAGFMAFTGLVSSEHSSGEKIRKGSITKAGNAHIRRVLIEAGWCYRHKNIAGRNLALRRQGCPPEILRIAKKAQDRLHRKFWRMVSRSKPYPVAVTAVARELAGFVWSIVHHAQTDAIA